MLASTSAPQNSHVRLTCVAALSDEDAHATTHVAGGAISACPDPGPVPTRSRVCSRPRGVAGRGSRWQPAAASTQAVDTAQQPLTPALAAQLSKNVNQHVIVIMKSQLAAAHVGSAAAMARAGTIASDQAPLMSELRQVHATHVKSYQLVNSFAATVSAGEVARLKANPAVAEVIPDVTIHGARSRCDRPATGHAAAGHPDGDDSRRPDARTASPAPARQPRRSLTPRACR